MLDVGCATGYSTAVLAHLAQSVIAVEDNEALATFAGTALAGVANVEFRRSRLEAGAPESGPYRVILVEGAVADVPDTLLEQLDLGGRLVAVVGHGLAGRAILFVREANRFERRRAFNLDVPELPKVATANDFFVF